MKVLIFINSLGAGGAERSMVEYARFLHESNITVKFVCFERRIIGLENEVEAIGIETIHLPNDQNGFKNHVQFALKIIQEENPDIIHSVLAKSNLILRCTRLFNKKGRLIQSLVNTPYSLQRKKDNKLSWEKFWMMKQIDKWSARLTKDIFYHAITRKVLEHYRPLFNIKENYEVIYRGRNINNFINNESNSDFTVISSGRQEFAKGHINLLKALVYLKEKYNLENIKVEILGREGAYTEKIKKYISEKGLGNQVLMPGFVTNVEQRLVRAQVFIFPSYYEGLGGALIEAFAAKLPCICSNIPVLKEVVGDKAGALFCAPGDYKCLAEQILKLYQDEDLRNSLSEYSYTRFKKQFQLEAINNQMLDMYKSVLKA